MQIQSKTEKGFWRLSKILQNENRFRGIHYNVFHAKKWLQPQHLESLKQKKSVIYITELLVKPTVFIAYWNICTAKYSLSDSQKPLFTEDWTTQKACKKPNAIKSWKHIDHWNNIFLKYGTLKLIVELSNIKNTLRKMCPNTEFFLFGTFLYSPRIQKNTYLKKLCI